MPEYAASISNPAPSPLSNVQFTTPRQILSVRPSLIAAITLRLAIFLALATITVSALFIANRLVGFDIIQFINQAAQDAMNNLWLVAPELANAIRPALETAERIAISIVVLYAVILLFRCIPLVSQQWVLYEDRLEYRKAFGRNGKSPLAAIALVGSKRTFFFLDIGSITVVLSGDNRPITIPMVLSADEKAERIRTVQRAAQEGWMRQATPVQPTAPQTL